MFPSRKPASKIKPMAAVCCHLAMTLMAAMLLLVGCAAPAERVPNADESLLNAPLVEGARLVPDGFVFRPRITVVPQFSEEFIAAGQRAEVLLELTVAPSGRVLRADVLSVNPPDQTDFAETVQLTLYRWVFHRDDVVADEVIRGKFVFISSGS